MDCPCGSTTSFDKCCGPILEGETKASTAEKLMRARYTAYSRGNIGFIQKTLAPESQKEFDGQSSKEWANQSDWLGLNIISTEKGDIDDKSGVVEFIAKYKKNGQIVDHHEVAQFRKTSKGEWVFVDGDAHTHKEGEEHHHHHKKPQTFVRESPKIGRNDPCSCGSGKKFKKCCGA